MWQNIIGLSFVLIGQLVATVDEFGIPALRYLWGILRSRRNTDQNDIDARKKSNDSRKSHYGTLGKIPIFVPAIALGVLSVALVVVVDVLDLGLPVWGSIFTICFAMLMSLALGMLIGTSGQNMAFPSSLLTQVLFGFMIPGNAPANIAASAINNAICSQSLTLFNDYRTALLCGVRPLDMMAMQLWGTGIGLVCSVLVYDNVMTRWANGSIVFDVGVWANLGASGAHINGEIFGQPRLTTMSTILLIFGVVSRKVWYCQHFPDVPQPLCILLRLAGDRDCDASRPPKTARPLAALLSRHRSHRHLTICHLLSLRGVLQSRLGLSLPEISQIQEASMVCTLYPCCVFLRVRLFQVHRVPNGKHQRHEYGCRDRRIGLAHFV